MSEQRKDDERYAADDAPSSRRRRPPRKGVDINELPVWTWVGILLGVVVVGWGLWMMTHRNGAEADPGASATPIPAEIATTVPTGQAAPQATAQPPAAGAAATPTPIIVPTATPPLPAGIGVGMRVTVTGTGADKLRVRSGPGTDFATSLIVPDGTEFTILEGPQNQDGYDWWRLEMADGSVGWAVGLFLTPAR